METMEKKPTLETQGLELDAEKQVHVKDEQYNSSSSSYNAPQATSPDENTQSEQQQPEVRAVRGLRWILLCIGINSANFLYGLDNTIVADLQAAISESMDNVVQLGWLGVGFTLGSTAMILTLGKAYALFDTKWLYISCLVMFAAASALCGAAPSMEAIIVGRVWAGAAGAGMYLGTLNLVSSTTTSVERSMYLSGMGLTYGAGAMVGPAIGGAFADSGATWRWGFYINLVILAIFSPVYLFAIPSLPQQAHRSTIEKWKALDWVGMILIAATYGTLVVAFTFGGAIWAWNDGRFIALVVLFGVFLAAFVVSQYTAFLTTETDRLFPVQFLRQKQLVLISICMSCAGATLFVAVYYIPFYFLFVHGETGKDAAVRLLPFICIFIASVLTCGFVLPKVGYHMVWYLVSGILMVAGGAAMYTVHVDTSPSHIYGFSVLLGLSMITGQSGYDLAVRTVGFAHAADAIQFINIAQGQSQMIGLLIASAVFQSEAFRGMVSVLSGMGLSDAEIHNTVAGTRSDVFNSLSPEIRRRALDVIVGVIDKEYILVMVAGTLQVLCAVLMSKKRWP